MKDDAVVLLLCAGKEAGHVNEGEDRNVESVAETDEAGTLAARVAVEHTGKNLGLVGNHTYGRAAHTGETYDEVLGIISVDLEEFAVVDDAADHLIHIVRCVRAVGDDLVERILCTVDGVLGGNIRRFLHIVLGYIAEEFADRADHILFVVACEMSHTTLACVNACTAELLLGNLFAEHLLNYCRTCEEHIAGVLAHNSEVGQRG